MIGREPPVQARTTTRRVVPRSCSASGVSNLQDRLQGINRVAPARRRYAARTRTGQPPPMPRAAHVTKATLSLSLLSAHRRNFPKRVRACSLIGSQRFSSGHSPPEAAAALTPFDQWRFEPLGLLAARDHRCHPFSPTVEWLDLAAPGLSE
jgi:hypothetical protein